jgi:23S rRNA pseudouridine1911/1915/1917 synthase
VRFREQVPSALDGERVDRVVALASGLSRAAVADLIDRGAVRLDGVAVAARSHRVAEGQTVEVDAPDPQTGADVVADAAVPVTVVYEDDSLVVVDKPAGIVVHPGAGNDQGTLVQGLLARYPELAEVGDRGRPGVVHRLDRGTSGLLVVARTQPAYEALVTMLKDRRVGRVYEALVWGQPQSSEGMIDAPIARSERHRTKMTVSADGRAARTRYSVLDRFTSPSSAARLRCTLDTGRTHQIRVHLSSIGHPVVGDRLYGGQRPPVDLDRPWLHAAALAFEHPESGVHLAFESAPPPELEAVVAVFS